ncbi:MAG TPA: glycosyltransferase family 39 protein [Acidimicrobiales bacterium]
MEIEADTRGGTVAVTPSLREQRPTTLRLRRRPPAWTAAVALYVGSRLAVLGAFVAATWIAPQLRFSTVFGASWDGGWYVRIAQSGYPDNLAAQGGGNPWAFFPGLPTAIRAVHEVTTLSYSDSAVVVALITGLTGTLAVWLAVRNRFGDEIANRSVALLVFFPIAFVLSMAYTEGLFLTFAGLCLYALDRKSWYPAAVFAAAASLTRSVGVVLILCVAVSALIAVTRDRQLKPLVATVVAGLPLLGWLIYADRRTGVFLAFARAERDWGGGHFVWFTAPFHSLAHLMTSAHAWRVAPDVLASFALVFVTVGLALLVVRGRLRPRLPASWWVFTIGSVAVALSPFWPNSILRFCFVVFPLFVGIAARCSRYFSATVGTFAAAQGALAIIAFVSIIHWQTAPFAP